MLNPFWRNTKLEKHHPDPLDTNNPPSNPPPDPAPNRSRGCTCEFCGCQLTGNGEIIKMGDKAKTYRKHDQTIEDRDAEISRLNTENAKLKQENDALKGSGSARSGHNPGNRVSR